MSEALRETYARLAAGYDAIYAENPSPYVQLCNAMVWRSLARALAHLDTRAPRVLDGGGGTGLWAAPLAEAGARVVVLDISRAMLEVARQRVGARAVEADLLRIPFANAAFDLVLLQGDPLSYAGGRHDGMLREAARVLRPGGVLAGSADNLPFTVLSMLHGGRGLDAARAKWLERTGRDPHGSATRLFTARELRDALASAGFDVLRLSSVPPIPLAFDERSAALLHRTWSDARAAPGGVDVLLDLLDEVAEEGGLESLGVHYQFLGQKPKEAAP